MKRLRFNLRILLFATGMLFVALNGYSQDPKEMRKDRREERRAALLANFSALDTVLNARRFVLEADFLVNTYGERVHVSSMINFIKVDSAKAVLQTGSDFRFGYNGVGGVTAEGSVGAWKLNRNFKSLSYTLRFNVITQIGTYDVVMMISSDNRCLATITGLSAGRLTYDGYLVAPYNSKVFKGQNTI